MKKTSKKQAKKDLKKEPNPVLMHLSILALCYYLLPFFPFDNATLLFSVFPVATVIISYVAAFRFGFFWYVPLAVVISFIPALMFFYNFVLWPCAVLYGGLSLLACFFGSLVRRYVQSKGKQSPLRK